MSVCVQRTASLIVGFFLFLFEFLELFPHGLEELSHDILGKIRRLGGNVLDAFVLGKGLDLARQVPERGLDIVELVINGAGGALVNFVHGKENVTFLDLVVDWQECVFFVLIHGLLDGSKNRH